MLPTARASDSIWSEPASYSPYLDGLRTVAVYLVVAFHSGLGAFAGGFIGVDVFFVLSGFLVTRLLVRDLTSSGRIAWRRFYSRRARRILPASLLTLLVTAIAWRVIATPVERLDSFDGVRAAFLYFANWHFISQSRDYFAADVNTNPVLHFWSLAIEEQFYLLWPMLLGGAFALTRALGRWRWIALRGLVAVGALASLATALHLDGTNLARAYYGTDTRAYQLLLGALIALMPQVLALGGRLPRVAAAASALALIGLILLATSLADIGAVPRGLLAAILAAVLISSLAHSGSGAARRALSLPPITYLGRISYGTYLWHWPVIAIVSHEWQLSSPALFAISCCAATALAAASFRLVEHPVRVSALLDRHRTPVIAAGMSLSLLGGLAFTPVLLRVSGTTLVAGGTARHRGRSTLPDWRKARTDIPALPDCLGSDVRDCTIVRGHGPHLLLIGDSAARMWIPAFQESAKRAGSTFSVAVYPGCPWQRGLQYLYAYLHGTEAQCRRHQDDWYERVIPRLDPDIVLLSHQAYDDPALAVPMVAPDGRGIGPRARDFERVLQDASRASIDSLKERGRKIVILEPIPVTPREHDPLACLASASTVASCAFEASPEPTPLERYYRGAVDEGVVWSLDLDRVACPHLPRCDPVVDNVIVRRDNTHLTATFARAVAAQVESALRRSGLLGS